MDWNQIKTEYVTGEATLEELAKAHGVSRSSIFRHSKEESWTKLREKHRRKVTANACARVGAKQGRKLASVIAATDRVAQELEEELRDPRVFHRHVGTEFDENGSSYITDRDLKALNTKAIRDITRSLRDLTAAIRDLYGIDTRREQVADALDEKRLALEERKVALAEAEAQRERDEAHEDIVLRIEGMPKEYTP